MLEHGLNQLKSKWEGEILEEKEVISIERSGEQKEGSLPLLYVPGWGESSLSTRSFLEELASDRDVVSFDQPREMRLKEMEGDYLSGESSEMPLLMKQKILAVIDALDFKQYDKVDAIGSSEGGMILAVTAYFFPNKFRSVVLNSPAGIIGKDTLLGLANRFAIKNGKQNKNRPSEQKNLVIPAKKDFRQFWQENILQSIKEIKNMAKADIIDIIEGLNNRGVKVSIVSHVNDQVFPSDKMQREISARLGRKNNDRKRLPFQGFYTIRSRRENENGEMETYDGGHADIKYDKNYRKLIKEILDPLTKVDIENK